MCREMRIVSLLIATLMAAPSRAKQPDSAWSQCVSVDLRRPPEQRITACNQVIVGGLLPADTAAALVNRGDAHLALGRAHHAMRDYDEAIRLSPKDAAAFAARCGAFSVQQRYDRALKDCDEAARLGTDGRDGRVALYRMLALTAKQRQDAALKCYDATISNNPQDAGALSARCRLKAQLDEFDQARSDCDRSLALRPNHAPTLDNRARVHLAQHDFTRARQDWDAAIALASPAAIWEAGGIVATSTCSVSKSVSSGQGVPGISLVAMLHYGRALARERQGDRAGAEADFAAARLSVPDERMWWTVGIVMRRSLDD